MYILIAPKKPVLKSKNTFVYVYIVLQVQDYCVSICQTLIGWSHLTDTTGASQRVRMCLKKGVSVCTCVSVGTIYCDDVNSESTCRLTFDLYCISECETQVSIYCSIYWFSLLLDYLLMRRWPAKELQWPWSAEHNSKLLNTTVDLKKKQKGNNRSKSRNMTTNLCLPLDGKTTSEDWTRR